MTSCFIFFPIPKIWAQSRAQDGNLWNLYLVKNPAIIFVSRYGRPSWCFWLEIRKEVLIDVVASLSIGYRELKARRLNPLAEALPSKTSSNLSFPVSRRQQINHSCLLSSDNVSPSQHPVKAEHPPWCTLRQFAEAQPAYEPRVIVAFEGFLSQVWVDRTG